MPFVFRPAKHTVCVEKKSIAWLKIDRRFSEFRLFDQPQRRRNRSDRFGLAIGACDQKRGMARADNAGLSGYRIKRHTHRRHERTSAENTAKVIVHGLQYA